MNVDNQIIAHIKAGSVMPEELLRMILAKKPNAFGFAVQGKDDDGDPELTIVREDGTNLSMSELSDLMKNRLDYPTTLYFGNLKDEYNPEDIQPFIVSDANNTPYMAIFLEGTMTGHDDPEAHTEQYNYVNGLLIPKVLDLCEVYEGDIERIAGKMNGEVFNKDFLAHVGHRAVLSILPVAGDVITLGKNELGEVYDWGSVSIVPKGFGETKQEPVAEKPKSKFSWGGNKAKAEDKKDPPGVHRVGATTIKDVASPGTGDKGSVPKVEVKTSNPPTVQVKPPNWLHKNDDKRLWYKLVCGELPDGWKRGIAVAVKNGEAAKIGNLDELKAFGMKEAVSNKPKMETATPPAPITQPPAKELPDSENLPVLPPKELEQVLEFVTKHLDAQSKEIPDPKIMQELETKFPVFSESVGLKPHEILNWPVKELINFAKKHPEAIVMYALEFRSLARPHIKVPEKTVQTTTIKSGDSTVKTESVDKTAPKKFAWGRK